MEYTLNIQFNIEGGKELLYDEIPMISSFDISAQNDVVFPKILNNKIDHTKKRGKLPSRNSMKMTESEYREFISTFGFSQNFMKNWMNNVAFKNGIRFPYKADEL